MSKHLLPVIVALALTALVVYVPKLKSDGGGKHVQSKEELAQLAFEALQQDDFGRIEGAIATGRDLEATFERAPDGAERARRRAAEKGGVLQMAARTHRRVEATFVEARDKGAKQFDWANAKYLGLDEARSQDQQIGGVTVSDVEFRVKAAGEEIPIRIQQVFHGDDRLAIVGGFLYRPVEPGTPEHVTVKLLKQVASAIRMHKMIHKELPANLAVLRQDEGHIGKPLLPRDPIDAWGRPVVFEKNENGTWHVASYGPDALPNTDDDLIHLPR